MDGESMDKSKKVSTKVKKFQSEIISGQNILQFKKYITTLVCISLQFKKYITTLVCISL